MCLNADLKYEPFLLQQMRTAHISSELQYPSDNFTSHPDSLVTHTEAGDL